MRSSVLVFVVSPAAGYTYYATYTGYTAYNGHGAVEIDTDATAPDGLSVAQCQAYCDADAACDCVAYEVVADGYPGHVPGKCWKRSACVPSQFGPDSHFNVFVKYYGEPSDANASVVLATELNSYTPYLGYTAYNGHGAVEIDTDATAPDGLTEAECQARCDADAACDCVAYELVADGYPGHVPGKCWKRSACVPSQFGPDSHFNVFVKMPYSEPSDGDASVALATELNSYNTYSGYTCYNGHGAVEIDTDATAPNGLSVAQCQAYCDADAACDCVAYELVADGYPGHVAGKCWKRSACVPSQFGPDSHFEVFVKMPYSGVEVV